MTFLRRRSNRLILALLVLGVGLRVGQYLADTSLWVDDIPVVRNVLDRSAWTLLSVPLDYGQVAPKGFLLAEKLTAMTLGASDYALKFFPLFCSLVALVAFWRVAGLVLDEWGAALALALFVAAGPLIAFTSQVKQYSTDVAIAVLLLWLALDLERGVVSRRRSLWAGMAGAAAVWFSQPAVLVLAGLGVVLALRAWPVRNQIRDRRLVSLGPILALWAASALAATLAGLASMTPETRDYMHSYWAAGFAPWPATLGLEIRWPVRELKGLFGPGWSASLAYPFPLLYLALAAFGFFTFNRRRAGAWALVLAPIAVALAAAAAHQYPFSDRLILFLLPSFFLAIASSIEWIREHLSTVSGSLGWVASMLLVGPALYPVLVMPPAYRNEDMKPVLAFVQTRRQPGDLVYVYYGAEPSVSFYGTRYNLSESSYSLGGCYRGNSRRYLHELDTFRGQARVWVLLTHALQSYHERDDIVHYLDTIGVERDTFMVASRSVSSASLPAEAFLYDLSDASRLSEATADSFPLIGPASSTGRLDCEPTSFVLKSIVAADRPR
jgi:hypothetical protein